MMSNAATCCLVVVLAASSQAVKSQNDDVKPRAAQARHGARVGGEGKAATPGAASYWKTVRRIDERIRTAVQDVSLAGTSCGIASVSGGYGPACNAAAQQASDALDHLRDWREEAEDLTSPDAEFHALWLKAIRCREDEIRIERDQARFTQIAAAERALEAAQQSLAKERECGPLEVEVFSRLLHSEDGESPKEKTK